MAANDSALHRTFVRSASVVACLCLLATGVLAQDNRTVLGPGNLQLHEGALALKAGDAKEGVRLTMIGLSMARNARERITGKSNLCAGHTLLGEFGTALAYCNEVLEENDQYWRAYSNRALIYIKLQRFDEAEQDLLKGEAISPKSNTLALVRKMYRDATDPVSPSVVIDDRQDVEGEAQDAD